MLYWIWYIYMSPTLRPDCNMRAQRTKLINRAAAAVEEEKLSYSKSSKGLDGPSSIIHRHKTKTKNSLKHKLYKVIKTYAGRGILMAIKNHFKAICIMVSIRNPTQRFHSKDEIGLPSLRYVRRFSHLSLKQESARFKAFNGESLLNHPRPLKTQ